MATTGELRAIIEQLQLVDIGEAASYLGEEGLMEDELAETVLEPTNFDCPGDMFYPVVGDDCCTSRDLVHV